MKKTLLSLIVCVLSCAGIGVQAQHPLFLQDNYYQKRMVKVFKSLNDHKLDKAAKYWEDIKNKSLKDKDIDPNVEISKQLFPLWQLSECMMMNIKDGRGKSTQCLPYDPWGAYNLLRTCYRDTYDIASADLFFADDHSLKMTVADIKSGIERNLVDSVRKIGTEDAYDQLIEVLFDCKDLPTLKDERELVAYNGVKYSLELDKCQAYLDKYSDHNKSHFMVIEWKRDSLAYEQVDSTSASCLRYMELYPRSSYYTAVEQQLHHCAFNEMDTTVEACKQYLDKYPESRFVYRVQQMELDYAYRDARSKNTVGSYLDFVTKYPDSDYAEEAKKLMQQNFSQHYFNNRVSRTELYCYCNAVNPIDGIRDNHVRALFENLLWMPTSTIMNNCDGLTGEVSVTTSTLTSENVEELIFNQQGLLIRHTNRATGQSDDYSYDFDSNFGFKLTNKTDSHGKLVSYITKWNDDGSLAEIRGSDNSRIVYLDSEEFYKKITHYKGSSVIKTDCYDDKYRLVKTILPNNVTIEYGYNPQGDVISMMKIQGTNVTDQSSFDYDYEENVETGRHWVTKTQFDDTRVLQTKVRHFYQTTARLQSDNRIKYEIDWNFDKEPTIVTDKNLLRN